MRRYASIITVTATAPKGFTIGESKNYGEKAKLRFLDFVKEKCEKINSKVPLTYSASSLSYEIDSMCVDEALYEKPSQEQDNLKE